MVVGAATCGKRAIVFSHTRHPYAAALPLLPVVVPHLRVLRPPFLRFQLHTASFSQQGISTLVSDFILALTTPSTSPQPSVFLSVPPLSIMSSFKLSKFDTDEPRVFVIHENPVWLPPFAAAFDRLHLPWTDWDLSSLRTFDLSVAPPEGIFYNRMSASSHTRDHRYAAELTVCVLAWLTRHGRRVVNGPGAIDLEISKSRQYAALESAGLRVPRTVLVQSLDAEMIVSAAQQYFPEQPIILKPNRGGKGQLIDLHVP